MKLNRLVHCPFKTLIFCFIIASWLPSVVGAQYTLKDDDVTVEDGIITEYDTFNIENIIIPDTLDGQAIRGIADYVFHHNEREPLKSVAFPSTLEFIGVAAFNDNDLTLVDLGNCPSLDSIGVNAFKFNQISSLLLPDGLRIIGDWAFYGNNLDSLSIPASIEVLGERSFSRNNLTEIDLSGSKLLKILSDELFLENQLTDIVLPPSIERIGNGAFQSNMLTSIDLSSNENLRVIGYRAFSQNMLSEVILPSSIIEIETLAFSHNNLSSVDLSPCTSLLSIRELAFGYNDLLNPITLPVNIEYEELGWRDLNENVYSGGDDISDFNMDYYVPAPYRLTDEDVVVINGVIENCVPLLPYRVVVIPDTLDGQLVTSIDDGIEPRHVIGVFSEKGITEVSLPAGLKTIGFYAFAYNELERVDFSACNDLVSIKRAAFAGNHLDTIELPESIEHIWDIAFGHNELAALDLTSYAHLSNIGSDAFSYNEGLTGFVLPVHEIYPDYEWRDNLGNIYEGGEEVTNFYTSYYIPVPYTLGDDDVEVVNGIIQSCSYHFAFRDIVIPDTLDGQEVLGLDWAAGSDLDMVSISLPATLQTVGKEALSGFMLKTNLNECPALVSIEKNAFQVGALDYFILPTNELYEQNSWMDSQGNFYSGGDTIHRLWECYYIHAPYTLTEQDVTVDEGVIQSCSYIFSRWVIIVPDSLDGEPVTGIASREYGKGVFQSAPVIDLKLPSTLVSIGDFAFCRSNIRYLDLSACKSLTHIGKGAFRYNYDLDILDLDSCHALVAIEDQAFQLCDIHQLEIGNCAELFSIGDEAFDLNHIDTLDLGGCVKLYSIGNKAFWVSNLKSVNFEGCNALAQINDYAFFANELDDLNLSNCTRLTYIGYDAFRSNSLTGFHLPVPEIPGFRFENWTNIYGDIIQGGELVSSWDQSYSAVLTPFFNVSFTVMVDSEPIAGAHVTLSDSLTLITDADGQAEFHEIFPAAELSFFIAASGFAITSGTITVVDRDVSEHIEMTPLNTGSDQEPDLQFSIFPNPATDHIQINSPGVASLTVWDLMGRPVYSRLLSEGISTISLSHLPRGFYLVRLTTEVTAHKVPIVLQ